MLPRVKAASNALTSWARHIRLPHLRNGTRVAILLCALGAPIGSVSEMKNTTKPVYYIGTYDIDDPELFKQYPVRVAALLPKYGGQVLASDTSAYVLEGKARRMNAIIRFPSREAALGLYNDPEYQEAKKIRHASTSNATMVLVEEFQR